MTIRRQLTGTRAAKAVVQDAGTRYENCPAWVADAVDRCVDARLVPRPRDVIWHLRQTSTRMGTCWPEEGRVHVYPWVGWRQDIDDELHVDVSGELTESRITPRLEAGAQDDADLRDTLAHELAHLVHRAHDEAHKALTERLRALIER